MLLLLALLLLLSLAPSGGDSGACHSVPPSLLRGLRWGVLAGAALGVPARASRQPVQPAATLRGLRGGARLTLAQASTISTATTTTTSRS